MLNERRYRWSKQARPNQIAPAGDWRTWLILAGRGWGKTRTGAEWVRQQVRSFSLVNLIGATADDARDIMIEGESGILAICPNHERPTYKASSRQLHWPNGARSLIFTADEPERLRGKQHMKLWADELCSWRYQESWDQAMLGLRLGSNPQVVVTTTPRPIKIVRDLLASSTTVVTRGTTYENRSNLAAAFMEQIIAKYEGTRLGRQELNAEVLDDNPGALWKRAELDEYRVLKAPDLTRVVVAIDPTASTDGDEAGIIAAGLGVDRHFYVLEDASLHASPGGWARAAIALYHKLHADRIVAEINNGGEMVEYTLRTIEKSIPYKSVHASRGKQVRAEPVAALYEQGKCHHVGTFAALEDEQCQWTPGNASPNRMDALVWAATELILQPRGAGFG
jgi:phage terminase large subunit-like protein